MSSAPRDRSSLVITFYSYKGGVGRTFAMANIGVLLAKWGARVLLIDWDLEAPGLHHYFSEHVSHIKRGLLDAVESVRDGGAFDWASGVRRLTDLGHLDLLPAGDEGASYVDRLQTIDWNTLYRKHGFGEKLEAARDEWCAQYDFILVDSRTGISDIGGICTVQLPDILVAMGTANEQSLSGLQRAIKGAAKARQGMIFERGGVPVVPVLSRFAGRQEHKSGQKWLARYGEAFEPQYGQWVKRGLSGREVIGHTKISNYPYWSFGERLPVLEPNSGEPDTIGYDLESLAALLKHQLMDVDRLIKDRAAYVAEAGGQRVVVEEDWLVLPPEPTLSEGYDLTITASADGSQMIDPFEYRRAIQSARSPFLRQEASNSSESNIIFRHQSHTNVVYGARVTFTKDNGTVFHFRYRDDNDPNFRFEEVAIQACVTVQPALELLFESGASTVTLAAQVQASSPMYVAPTRLLISPYAIDGYRLGQDSTFSVKSVLHEERYAGLALLFDRLAARMKGSGLFQTGKLPAPHLSTEAFMQLAETGHLDPPSV